MSFAVGQRWISESENNLGLGIITARDNRTVTITFPASEEVRIYALAGAPLIRVAFQIGDQITHQTGWQGQVLDVTEKNELLFYWVRRNDNAEECLVREIELNAQITFSKPQERLFSAQLDRNDHFALRYQTLCHQQAQFQSSLRGLRGTRASLIPHQLYIAQEVGNRVAPRVLLADEVGLGKTIEAGMILQQQLFSERVERALILVPENLQHQWLVEMLRRFNLPFALFDEERCADFDQTENRSAENPFHSESLILCSIDWLLAQPHRAAQLDEAEFDLLIVDEAHHLEWSPTGASDAYRLVERLSRRIAAVLLLTATPEQLSEESHFARLSLLDPARFYDYDAFVQEQRQYRPVAEAVQSLLADKPLSREEQNHLTELLSEQDIEPSLKVIQSQADDALRRQARQSLIGDLIDRHGTGRLLFRNTRQSVKGFPQRVYHQINLPLPAQYANALNVLARFGELETAEQFYPEQLFQRLNPQANWWDFDPRITWLLDFLLRYADEKILLICHQAETVVQLERILREKDAVRCAVFHERMSIVERDRAAAYFAQQEGGAQVLLSSSIGSEGRNFQFACRLVLFNLPDNPDLLEQCIGRLDRIGQQRDIQIYAPCFTDTPAARLAQWYHDGLNAFEETCPMGATLFAKCGEKLQYFLQNPTALEEFDVFIRRTREERQGLKTLLESGRDRLLELNSNGGERAESLAQRIAETDCESQLIDFALNLFDIIGFEQEDSGEKTIVLHPTGTMLIPNFPGVKEEGVTVTFDRRLALAREDIEFLTWDHPMIRHGIDLIASGELGKSAVAFLLNNALPAGTLLLETIFIVETQAPKGLQLNRFLPPTPIRLLLDAKGNDLAPQVSFAKLQKQLKPMGKSTGNQVVKMLRPQIESLIRTAEQKAKKASNTVIKQAQRVADEALTAEWNRLTALRAVNPAIRPDEIEMLATQREQALTAIRQATWRLDCLRVIVSNKS
ncbi:RNA polymerase-associated protein RapA [Caviibacterium pharyngocola]|uniref:RNA polymerase-associated protein RapA n=1 Tax=Caviibacterium pharyngocola TaxID=28159 RepID=A0A2M8RXE4_9PAST|nr:RNA polymerase-associated protein RapA [Caviibacterium pharyngocola]PJG83548.1 RNA polymerase-associated protein RapA [Caviibacterium pharyngocola]